ncbi:MAG: DUF815 domain-containing protein [Eubacteriales bacterium]|nr:DUF815 domain-containing protein [Eubacteriales bacterium]
MDKERKQADSQAVDATATAEQQLTDCRDRLDRLDRQIVDLITARFDIVREVGRIKYEQGWPVLDQSREAEKLERIDSQAGEYGRQLQELYRFLMAQSRELEGDAGTPVLSGLLFDFSTDELICSALTLMQEMAEQADIDRSDREEQPNPTQRRKREEQAGRLRRIWAGLIREAVTQGWQGNLWQAYLTRAIITADQPLAGRLERGEELTREQAAVLRHEMKWLLALWQLDWQYPAMLYRVELPFEWQPQTVANAQPEMTPAAQSEVVANAQPGQTLVHLQAVLTAAATGRPEQAAEYFFEALTTYYRRYGYGDFSLYGGFVVKERDKEAVLQPISGEQWGRLDDIIGYERQKQKLIHNTELFLDGFQANHCLLYGPAGTGKSSCVRALLSHYFQRGLRILELGRDQLHLLPQIFERLRGRAHRWLILMDDLSFEDFEVEYKQLKVMMEGGLAGAPANVLFYATGNRRHITQTEEGTKLGVPSSDQKQERLSLAARFGETILFDSPDRAEFNQIVLGLAERFGLDMEREELLKRANAWELMHHGRCGRSALQFIRSIQQYNKSGSDKI